MSYSETAERVIGRLRTDPVFLAENQDGGEAAFDFIRNARSRNARSQAQKDASRRASAGRVLAWMQENAR
jgi:hypothetical protein